MLIEHIYIKIIDEVVVTKLHIHIKEVIVQIHVDEGVRIDDDEVVLGRRSWHQYKEENYDEVLLCSKKGSQCSYKLLGFTISGTL